MGILVRNAIIMYDYAEELRETEHLTAHEAIQLSAKRRMRPIFLTLQLLQWVLSQWCWVVQDCGLRWVMSSSSVQ